MSVFYKNFTIIFVLFIFLVVLLIRNRHALAKPSPKLLHVVVIATDTKRTDRLIRSLNNKNGYKVHLKGVGENWTGYEIKLLHTLNLAQSLRRDDILMHLDAYDTYVLVHAEEIIEKFLKMNANIIVSTETNLAPNWEFSDETRRQMDGMYPTAPNRFRWINSGTYIGYAGAIADLLGTMPSNFFCDLPTGQSASHSDDQRCFHTYFLKDKEKFNIKLDYNQEIFHCMWGVDHYSLEPLKRIRSETGSMPCVLHGNGNAQSFSNAVETIHSSL